MITRRQVIATAAFALAAASLPLGLADAAMAQTVKPDDLAQQGPLGDVVLGSADAKVTIVEYASLTCSHCAHFHDTTLPELKTKYIDTGKVRFILREFPLDPLATAGFMLARCSGNEKYYPMTDLLFSQQKNWAFVERPVDALFAVVKQAGFTQETAEACLKRQDIYDAVNAVKNRGADVMKVDATPTFFINGQKRSGALSIAEIDEILKPLLSQ